MELSNNKYLNADITSNRTNFKDDSIFVISEICRGCLTQGTVTSMDNDSILVYEDITKVKVEIDESPIMICAACALELNRTEKFIRMLRESYLILLKVFGDSKSRNKKNEIDPDKNNLGNDVLKEEAKNTYVGETEQIIIETDVKNVNIEDKDDVFLEKEDISMDQVTDSSDDEIPLSERFKISTENKSSTSPNEYTSPKKRGRKKKRDNDNLPNNNTLHTQKKSSELLHISDLQNCCPLCCKKVRLSVKHLKSIHSLDLNNCTCLKCFYYNGDKDALIEHCKECTKSEPKSEDPEYFKTEGLKIEWLNDEELDNNDPDFEFGDELKESEDDVMKESGEKVLNGRRKKTKNYTCLKCKNVILTGYENIEAHLKNVHGGDSRCIICEREYTNFFSLLYHTMVKHGKLKCCRLCLVSFRSSKELSSHYKSEEHNTKCSICSEQFKNRKALYEHRRKKHLNPQMENQKYKCPECPKEFANENNIKRHIMVAHNDLRFLCDTCGQSYTTKRNLKLHIQKFHEGIEVKSQNTKKNFFCESCGRELKIFHKYAIAMHRAKHKGHNFVCRKCYDSFPSEQDFKKHVEELGHQLYECDKCQSQFVREENFKSHLKNHDAPGWNKNMFATWGQSAKLRNEKGEFVCSYCPKVFKDKQRLDNHVRVHTNERPYKCQICDKGFKTWIHRKTHLNIHLGIKKWVCKYCSKAFTNSCTLKVHEMIHTGERPHRCPECKKGFITVSAMKKHRMVHLRNGSVGERKKAKMDLKQDKLDEENNTDLIYKYGQIFTGSDVSYESFVEPTKEAPVGLVSIEKELSC